MIYIETFVAPTTVVKDARLIDVPGTTKKRLNVAIAERSSYRDEKLSHMVGAADAKLNVAIETDLVKEYVGNLRRCGKRLTGEPRRYLEQACNNHVDRVTNHKQLRVSHVHRAIRNRRYQQLRNAAVKEIEGRLRDARQITYEDIVEQIKSHPMVSAQSVTVVSVETRNATTNNLFIEFELPVYHISELTWERGEMVKPICLNGGNGFKPLKMFPVRVLINPENMRVLLSHTTTDELPHVNRFYTNGGVHPHQMPDRSPCLGDFGPAVQEAATQHDFRAVVDVLIMWLSTVNLSDPAGRSFFTYLSHRISSETGVEFDRDTVIGALTSPFFVPGQGNLIQDDETGAFSVVVPPIKTVELDEMNAYIRDAISTTRANN